MTRKNAEIASQLLRDVKKPHSTYPSIAGGWRVQVWTPTGAIVFSRLRDVRAYVATIH